MKRTTCAAALAIAVIACGDDTAVTDGGADGSVQPDVGNSDVTISDSGGDTSISDGAAGDASDASKGGDGGGTASITCGAGSCPLPSQACCWNGNQFSCSGDAGTCPAGDVSFQCASAADCASGQVCCLDSTVDPSVAKCAATCGGQDHARLCDPKGTAQANACGDASACGNSNIDTWNLTNKFGTCGDVSGPF